MVPPYAAFSKTMGADTAGTETADAGAFLFPIPRPGSLIVAAAYEEVSAGEPVPFALFRNKKNNNAAATTTAAGTMTAAGAMRFGAGVYRGIAVLSDPVRTASGTAAAFVFAPQFPQNVTPSFICVPQFAQNIVTLPYKAILAQITKW
jgi:hypothetical protein